MSKHRYALEMTWKEFGKVGYCPRAEDFDHTLVGLIDWMRALGIRWFSAREVVEPHNEAVAQECGFTILLPPKDTWEALGVCLLIADEMRERCKTPIYLRNAWRPECYNARVGGASKSDHLGHGGCMAFDLDFLSYGDRLKVDALVESLYQKDWLELSVGKGDAMYHIGCLSEKGRRKWYY